MLDEIELKIIQINYKRAQLMEKNKKPNGDKSLVAFAKNSALNISVSEFRDGMESMRRSSGDSSVNSIKGLPSNPILHRLGLEAPNKFGSPG